MFMRTAVTRQVDPAVRQVRPGSVSWPAPIPLDAWREGDTYVIALDLPGIEVEAVDVEVTGRLVTVRAERRPAELGQEARVEASERRHGVFARRIELADTLDPGRLKARLHDGVLTLTVPVSEITKPRKIAVQGAAAPAAA